MKWVLTVLMCAGCVSVKPYEKQYLVDPTMDEVRFQSLESTFGKSVCQENEKLGEGASGGAATSCPTCGG